MLGPEHRWLLLHPLLRGALLTLALACLCVATLSVAPDAPATGREPAPVTAGSASPTVDQRAAWPRTVLRLWFLLPQFVPLRDR